LLDSLSDLILSFGRKPEVRLRRIEGFETRHQQRYWAKRHFWDRF